MPSLDLPVRSLSVTCRPEGPLVFPRGGTLGPYHVLRGLLGAALTERSPEAARSLFKPSPTSAGSDGVRPAHPVPVPVQAATVRAEAGPGRSAVGQGGGAPPGGEAAASPWRLRLGPLFGRPPSSEPFTLRLDVLGERPCDRVEEFVEAIRLAGSGRRYRDRHGRDRAFGIDLVDDGGRTRDVVRFDVIDHSVAPVTTVRSLAAARARSWARAGRALLVLRTLSVLTRREAGRRKGVPLGPSDDLDPVSLLGNTLRRLAVLHEATRRDPAGGEALREEDERRQNLIGERAVHVPLACVERVLEQVRSTFGPGPATGGVIGTAVFAGRNPAAWVPGFVACEVLGLGESSVWGAGQCLWMPLAG